MASPFTASKPHRSRPEGLDPASVHQFVEDLLGEDLHAKRVLSLANGVVGVLHGATLAIHAIGQGLATATGATAKHAVKQIDRMLSNLGIDIESLAPRWVSFVIAERDEIVVALDWTDFDDDDQTTLVLNVITNHGRATPLLWKTVPKKGLKTRRNGYEDELLLRLREAVPVEVAPGVHFHLGRDVVASVSAPQQADLGRYEVTLDPRDRWARSRARTQACRSGLDATDRGGSWAPRCGHSRRAHGVYARQLDRLHP